MSRRRTRHYTARYRPMSSRWSFDAALRRTRCRITGAKAALADIIATWGDNDQYIVNGADDRINDLDAWLDEIRDAIAERRAAGEDVEP